MNSHFTTEIFTKIKDANEHIKKILAELDTPKSMEFQVIHSLSETECSEEGGPWESIGEILLSYLRDLDSMQGFMIKREEGWDYLDWEEPDEAPTKSEDTFVYAGEGVVVIHNEFSVCENQFPIIVVKKSFWENHNDSILELLKYCDPGSDYTCKISPAVYVENFYVDDERMI